mmetsp:Transcript_89243/g.224439  ORF Transcript_89243/g.224439 Transcript_89243/m.224439 type:complete len:85 (+) Transcript_89243:207-461(+)
MRFHDDRVVDNLFKHIDFQRYRDHFDKHSHHEHSIHHNYADEFEHLQHHLHDEQHQLGYCDHNDTHGNNKHNDDPLSLRGTPVA